MALSFESSVHSYQEAQLTPATLALTNTVETSTTEETWTQHTDYDWYEEYYDENYSTVDELKRIHINSKHVNLSQEENSQIIPFIMPRYWDGIDLVTKKIMINFVNIKGLGSASKPKNFMYSDDEIKFYWLIDGDATAIAGKLLMEIYAYGSNEKNENYQWRTQPNSEIVIQESLIGNGAIEQTESWLSYLESVYEVANEAKTTADTAQSDVNELETVVDELSEQVDENTENISELEAASVEYEEFSTDTINELFT